MLVISAATFYQQQFRRSCLQRIYCAQNGKPYIFSRFRATSSRPTQQTRKERRRLEREAKKQSAKVKEVKSRIKDVSPTKAAQQPWSLSSMKKIYQRFIPNPRIPGGKKTLFHKSHRFHLISRFSIACALYLLLEWEDLSPYHLDIAQGPSMIPTFLPIGDIYIRETGALSRLLGIPIVYEKGDLVVFRDKDGRYAGKRIIGLAGDRVARYGQYAHLYTHSPDLGIVNPNTENLDDLEVKDLDYGETRDSTRQIVVPSDHVWLEGDFPPLSIDSRQYGPIPVDWIRGRIILRLWPWRSPQVTKNRPIPLTLAEAIAGDYNLHTHPLLSKDQGVNKER